MRVCVNAMRARTCARTSALTHPGRPTRRVEIVEVGIAELIEFSSYRFVKNIG